MEQKQQQFLPRSDLIHDAIGVPEIKFNLLPTTSSKVLLNKLVPHETKDERIALKALKRMSSLFTTQSSSDIKSDEITSRADIIEIEVPVIGNEFSRKSQESYEDTEYSSSSSSNEQEEMAPSGGYVEINVLPTTTTVSSEETEMINFQNSFDDETTLQNHQQTAPSSFIRTTSTPLDTTDMHAIESRLVDQYYPANFIEENELLPFETLRDSEMKPKRSANPFNVKIMVNNDEHKYNCKGKKSCTQVNYAKMDDIDREYYSDEADIDDDLFFMSELEGRRSNAVKSRRAADDGYFSSFNGISLTPAPRNAFAASNSFRALKKPSFIERLESESSLERSERVNKDLSNLMKFVAVWAHVDKFVSDRARSVVHRLARMTDEDYGDYMVGSRRRENNLRAVAEKADEPFT